MDFAKETVNAILLTAWAQRRREIAYFADRGDDGFVPVHFDESERRILATALRLRAAGFARGDKVAILSAVRAEWTEVDLGVLLAGLVTVGIYPSSHPDSVAHILGHSESRILVIEDAAQLRSFAGAIEQAAGLDLVLTMQPLDAPTGLSVPVRELADFITEGERLLDEQGREVVTELALRADPDDLMSLVYTSGTTGPPKGVMLSQGNLFYVCESVAKIVPVTAADVGLVYLPLAHILQRYAGYLGMRGGALGYYSHRLHELGELLAAVRPNKLAAVPRVLEKIREKAMLRIGQMPRRRQKIVAWALAQGMQLRAAERAGGRGGRWLRLKHAVADRLVFRKIRAKLGGRIDLVLSGGAPLAKELAEWFHAIGILVIEGYGLSETSAPLCTNSPTDFRFGTVGRAIPGTEVRIAVDGEIEARGPGIFKGYYKDEAASAAAFTEDGWFKTGDVGELSPDGYLSITDRKKDLIVTAGGKNVAPANIENLLKRHPLVGQAMVHGDQRKYLVCLLALDPEDGPAWAAQQGLRERDLVDLCRCEAVKAELRRHVEAVNEGLAGYESIKQWELLPIALTEDSGHLTPTLKLKRRQISADYGDVIEQLYEG